MPDIYSEQVQVKKWHSLNLPKSTQIIVWISLIVVFVLSTLDLIGWIFNIALFKNILAIWIPMKIDAALCFIFSTITIVLIQKSKPGTLWNHVSKFLSIIITVISLVTVIYYLDVAKKGHESLLATKPVLSLLLSPVTRMTRLGSPIFMFIGCILFLMSMKINLASDIAHFLLFPAAIASYFIPVSYILNVYSSTELIEIPVALNSGIPFCALCLALLLIRPETWLMKVFTSNRMGGIMARNLLPGLLLLPIIIGWLHIKGEYAEIFKSEVGVVLVALTYTVCFILIIWWTAKSINEIDQKRRELVEAVKKSNTELEMKVKERTASLMETNRKLDIEIIGHMKAQEEAEAERKRFNELLELMPAYLILLTPDYHVIYANRYFRERFGEDQGMRCFEYLFHRTEPCEVCETYKVLKDSKALTWEWEGPDGRNYSIYDFPFTDSNGASLIMEMGFDITDLKQAEATLKNLNLELEQKVSERTHDLESTNNRLHQELTDRMLVQEALKESESRLKELNATKDKFFNIVAHDLKNPFTSLLGSSELLFRNIEKIDHEKIKTLALILYDASKSGYAILQNLLDWSRSQTGLLRINPERINLRNLIDEDISNLEQFSSNKEIEIFSELKEDLFICADKNMIKTILRNLLSNSIKYSYRSGKVVVSAVPGHDKVIISVKDNGIGISKEHIEKIFRIDAKYSLPGTENEQGTGLGLKLSKEFAEKQGGEIWVESVENVGSEFKFSIPVKDVENNCLQQV